MCVCVCIHWRRAHRRPFMLLLPAWTAKWVPWRTFLWAMARVRKVDISKKENEALQRVCIVYIPGQ